MADDMCFGCSEREDQCICAYAGRGEDDERDDAPTPSELAILRRLRAGELVAVEAAENKRLRDAANHCRLAFAGYVSVRSAIDKIDALGSLHAPLAAKEEGNG